LSAAWSKLEAYAPRLALIIHLVRWAANDSTLTDPNLVDDKSMAAAIELTRWFAQEARRIYAVWGESADESRQRQHLERIERKGGEVTVRDWQRSRSIKTSADAEAELEELVAAGLGEWYTRRQDGAGHPTKVFRILAEPPDADKTPVPDA